MTAVDASNATIPSSSQTWSVNPRLTPVQLDKLLHGVARTLSPRTKMARISRAIPFVALLHIRLYLPRKESERSEST